MKPVRKTIAALALAVATASLAPHYAAAYGGECMPFPEQHCRKMGSELNLSDKQKQDIRDICAKSRTQVEPLMKQLRAEHRSLRTLIHADTINEAAIRAQSNKIAAIMADVAVQHAQTAGKVRALLTPEQAQKLKAIQAKRDSRMDEMTPCGERQHRRHR
jgi:Spy/CpxP family protein refolding chaperone